MKPAIKAIEGTLSKYEGIVYKVQLANTYVIISLLFIVIADNIYTSV